MDLPDEQLNDLYEEIRLLEADKARMDWLTRQAELTEGFHVLCFDYPNLDHLTFRGIVDRAMTRELRIVAEQLLRGRE